MDRMFRSFLENTRGQALDLVRRSDVLRLQPEPYSPPAAYLCSFAVPYLRRDRAGMVDLAPGPVLCLIRFPHDYLCPLDAHLYLRVASVLTADFVHPNATALGPVCLGSGFRPGTPIGELIHQLYGIVTYRLRTLDERNAIDAAACRLMRANPDLVGRIEAPPLFRAVRRVVPLVRRAGADHA